MGTRQIEIKVIILVLLFYVQANIFLYNIGQLRISTLSVQLYSDVTSANSVFVSDKVMNNSDIVL